MSMSSPLTSTPKRKFSLPVRVRNLKAEAVNLMETMMPVAEKVKPDIFVNEETLKAAVKDLQPVVLSESAAMNCVGIVYKKKSGQLLKTEARKSKE